ncbi:hypothetical protein SDC9_157375 [bioreactor metagenome]|uniref:Uncharacterized protein n=1 Tax=bioreactor metagenome TaxID=1076179 RepID=A0A645F950_9ZZZZ
MDVVVEHAADHPHIAPKPLFQHQFVGLDRFRIEMWVGGVIRGLVIHFIGIRSPESLAIQRLDCAVRPGVIDDRRAGVQGAATGIKIVIP